MHLDPETEKRYEQRYSEAQRMKFPDPKPPPRTGPGIFGWFFIGVMLVLGIILIWLWWREL